MGILPSRFTGYTATQILRQHGFTVKNLSGGFKTYRQAQFKPAPYSGQKHEVTDDQNQSDHVSHPKQNTLHQTDQLSSQPLRIDEELDVCGLSCPGPLIQVKQKMDQLSDGETLRVKASDPGFYEDVKAWAGMSGAALLQLERGKHGIIEAVLTKQTEPVRSSASEAQNVEPASTMVVFSGDLDKAIASLIIANGAAASGRKVTMFYTFWGLNIIRKHQPGPVSKT